MILEVFESTFNLFSNAVGVSCLSINFAKIRDFKQKIIFLRFLRFSFNFLLQYPEQVFFP